MFAKYWKRLTRSNPALGNVENKMTISVGSFQRQLKKAYAEGQRGLRATLKPADEFGGVKSDAGGLESLFSSFLGR